VKRALVLGVCAAALWAGACGSGGGSITPPPPPIGFSNSDLLGQYAFSMTGTTANTPNQVVQPYTRVGSFIADGKGNISGGAEDITIFQNGSNEFDFTAGSYTVNGDGRGTLSLTDSSGTLTFSITLTSATSGYFIDMPADGSSAGNGSFVKQNPASFQISGIAGNYAFDLSGVDPSGAAESVVGQLVSNSGGGFSGVLDDNDGGAINNGANGAAGATTISGSYGIDGAHPGDLATFGRGVFAIDGITGIFYIVGPKQVKFLETSSGGTLAGDSLSQSGIPTTAAGISGGFVYVMGGSTVAVANPLTRGGRFTTNAGNLTAILVDNNNGGQLSSDSATTGTYTIDPSGNGRGTVTFKVAGLTDSFSYVFYLISPTQAFIQDQSLNIVEDGSLLAQGTGTISNASLNGNYAINWSGVTNAAGEEDLVGATTLATSVLTGTIDLNEGGATNPGVTQGGSLKLSGDGTGHNALTVNLATAAAAPIPAFAYVAANNTILFVSAQTTRIVAGVLTPQTP
jgi:hypothetical protein